MKKNILVLTDFSENARVAMEYAVSFFSRTAVDFYVIHVVPTDVFPDDQSISGRLKPEDQLNLEAEVVGYARHPDHHFFWNCEKGSWSETVRNEVKRKRIDYIFLGAQGAGYTDNKKVGKNAAEIITKVKCPTVIVPLVAKYSGIKNIALPTDFNNWDQQEIADVLSEILAFKQAHLHILLANFRDRKLTSVQQNNITFSKSFLRSDRYDYRPIENEHIEAEVKEAISVLNIDLIALIGKNLGYVQRLLLQGPCWKTLEIPFLILHK